MNELNAQIRQKIMKQKMVGHESAAIVTYKELEEWANKAAELVKPCSIPDVSTRTEMRKQAITVIELTKGFTGESTDNAMKTALEMAYYVLNLTNDL